MRRTQATEKKGKIEFDGFQFDLATHSLISLGGKLELSPKPSQILEILLEKAGKLVTREEIATTVWGEQVVDFDQNINFCIKQIRQVLKDDPKNPVYLETVPKKGYRFIAETSLVTPGTKSQTRLLTFKRIAVVAGLFLFIIGFKLWIGSSDLPEYPAEVEQSLKRAYYLYEQGGPENHERSQLLFEKVLKDHPEVGEAHAGLGLLKSQRAYTRQARAQVKLHANRALELSPGSSHGHLIEAKILFYWEWNVEQARIHFQKAAELDPQSIPALHDLAVTAAIQGDLSSAEAAIHQALKVDPGRFQEHYHAGWFYQVAQRYDLALKQCVESLEIEPKHRFSLLCAGRSALKLNLAQTATHYLTEYMRLANVEESTIQPVRESLEKGIIEEFNRWYLDWLEQEIEDPFNKALALAELGYNERALAQLKQAVKDRHSMVPTAWAFDELSGLRDDPRFIELMSVVKRF
ncbi:winged helix-turn-helix domain-containing protein [Aliikangiella sp. G2MR2-5]|uniref:winged helix-turn-helix domain-containing protein n=1 Tax=Aliikangiella sp. G2MR2-5 TaxID=2788943 RepID=UPI0018A8A78E|nr:winged helix-turn-helix domain-containing protein [Aliikangiella sp. G2MR2-5]